MTKLAPTIPELVIVGVVVNWPVTLIVPVVSRLAMFQLKPGQSDGSALIPPLMEPLKAAGLLNSAKVSPVLSAGPRLVTVRLPPKTMLVELRASLLGFLERSRFMTTRPPRVMLLVMVSVPTMLDSPGTMTELALATRAPLIRPPPRA